MKLSNIVLSFVLLLTCCHKSNIATNIDVDFIAVYNQSAILSQQTGWISSVEFVVSICNTGSSDIVLIGNSLKLVPEISGNGTIYTTNFSNFKINKTKCDTIDFLVPFDRITNKEYRKLVTNDFSLMFEYSILRSTDDSIKYTSTPNQFRHKFDSDERPKTILKMLKCKDCCN